MAQQIVTYCDLHLAKGEHVHGRTWGIALTIPGERGSREFELDACEDCAGPFVALVADLQEHARQLSGPKSAPAQPRVTPDDATAVIPLDGMPTPSGPDKTPVQCALCDKRPKGVPAYASHLRSYHDTTIAEVEGKATLPCPVDGCKRKAANGTGLGAHLRNSHPEWLLANPDHWPDGWTVETAQRNLAGKVA
jgi:hypothetical protein